MLYSISYILYNAYCILYVILYKNMTHIVLQLYCILCTLYYKYYLILCDTSICLMYISVYDYGVYRGSGFASAQVASSV